MALEFLALSQPRYLISMASSHLTADTYAMQVPSAKLTRICQFMPIAHHQESRSS